MSSDSDLYIVFVLPEDGKSAGETMQKAFLITEKNRMNPKWLNANACLRLPKDKQAIFVCEDFEGPIMQKLNSSNRKLWIIGPMCIITCHEKGLQLPRLEHPVLVPTMVDFIICCTNLARDSRNEIHRKVALMGGVISRDFTSGVTHLIAGEVGSKKYHVAANAKIPIMLPTWVDECWEKGQTAQVHARDLCSEHLKCPVFMGVHLTVSQVEGAVRQNIRELVEANGGQYSGPMKSESTTHLVLLSPEGEKYIFGRKWKLHCVNVNWVYDSVKKKYCQDVALYDISKAAVVKEKGDGLTPVKKASTPIHGHSNSNMENTVMNCSAVPAILKPFNASNITSVEETMVIRRNDNEKVSLNASKVASSKEELDLWLNSLQCREDAGLYLDGCKIVLMGFSNTALDCVRKAVNAGGGVRYDHINSDVTHIVLGDVTPHLLKTLQDSGIRPHVVNLQWLVESRKQRKPVDESPFQLITYEKLAESPHQEDTVLDPVLANGQEKSQSKANTYFNDGSDMNDIIMQYAASESATEPGLDEVLAKAAADSDDSLSVFKRLTFLLEGFNKIDDNELASAIEASGGKTMTVAGLDTIVVVPVIGYNATATTNRRIVTDCWILSCIEASSLIPVKDERVFLPIDYKPNSQPLTSCVFSLSQYKSYLKDSLIRVGEYLGAKYEESLVRCNNQKIGRLASTHLVCAVAEGKKYEGALRWKLPVVTADWLLDCAKTGQMLPEDEYSPARSSPPEADMRQDNVSIARGNTPNAPCANSVVKSDETTPINSTKNQVDKESTDLCQSARNTTSTSLQEKSVKITPTSSIRTYQPVILTPNLKTPKLNFNKYAMMKNTKVIPNESKVEPCKEVKESLDAPPKLLFGGFPAKRGAVLRSLNYKLSEKMDLVMPFKGAEKPRLETPPIIKSKEATETVHKQMDDMLAAARVSNIKSDAGNLSVPHHQRSSITFDLDEHRKSVSKPPPEPSQATMVTWDDPTGRLEREKLHLELHRDSQADVNLPVEQEQLACAPECVVNDDEASRPPLRFMFSGLPTKDRGSYRKIVEDLGGTVSDSEDFDSSCTHLIIGSLSRNEKMLGSIASGIWVLKKTYLVKCQEVGNFVDEEDHVWRSNELSPGSRAANLAASAIRWRLAIQEGKKLSRAKVFPFYGWRTIVHLSGSRQGSICRLLKAGGATVLSHRPPFTNITDATHAFLDVNMLPKTFVDIESLVANGVTCLQMEYIGNFLMEANPPPESAYLVPGAERMKLTGQKYQKRKSSHDNTSPDDDSTMTSVTKRKK